MHENEERSPNSLLVTEANRDRLLACEYSDRFWHCSFSSPDP